MHAEWRQKQHWQQQEPQLWWAGLLIRTMPLSDRW